MKYPLVILLLPLAAAAVTVEELAVEPDSPDWAGRVEEVGLIELVAGLERIADDITLSAGARLDRLSRFADQEIGVEALLRVSADGLPILALAEGLPGNLDLLLAFYRWVVDDEARERLLVAMYLGLDVIREELRDCARSGDGESASAACVLFDLEGEVHVDGLVRALSLKGQPAMLSVLGLQGAGEEAYAALVSAIRERRPGAMSYAPVIFSAGGQFGVNFLDDYLQSPDIEVRRVAILVISDFSGKDYSYMLDYEPEAKDYIREGLPVPPELRED
ncbi:MAG TPA: hypothetical protein VM054_04020 [bacterium]|nr:hypothetical protein [bacterium]